MPKSQTLGPNGELLIPDEPDAARKVEEALAQEKRRFILRWVVTIKYVTKYLHARRLASHTNGRGIISYV